MSLAIKGLPFFDPYPALTGGLHSPATAVQTRSPGPSQPPRLQRSATWARVLLGEKSLALFSVFFLKIAASVQSCKIHIFQSVR
jgi:hypothetical protein